MMDFPQHTFAAIEFILDWDACHRIPMKASGEESTHTICCLQEGQPETELFEKTRVQKPVTLQIAFLQKVVLNLQDSVRSLICGILSVTLVHGSVGPDAVMYAVFVVWGFNLKPLERV